MQRALARPGLQDRADLLERLADLYDAWDKLAERDAVLAELATMAAARPAAPLTDFEMAAPTEAEDAFLLDNRSPVADAAPARRRPGRNDPCWCGSGLKYKRCHLRSDQQANQMNRGTTR